MQRGTYTYSFAHIGSRVRTKGVACWGGDRDNCNSNNGDGGEDGEEEEDGEGEVRVSLVAL